MKMKAIFTVAGIFSLMLVISPLTAQVKETLKGKVVKVSDGDTFTLLGADNQKIRVRLSAIDAPETGQPYSERSRRRLAEMIVDQDIEVLVESTDRYGRKIAKIKTPLVDDVGLQLVKEGLAWHYSYFDKSASYAQAEKQARENRTGLWQEKDPINPYDYRKMKKQR